MTEHKRLTTKEKYPHGAEGVSKDKLTGKYCRGVFEATACIEKLAQYETAEEEGRLVVLPCKVGDTVWVITHPFNVLDDFDFYEDAHDEIYESYISSVTFYEDSNQYRIYAKDTKDFIKAYFMECDFGKSIFLTREEAEKALEEIEKDE